MRWLLRLDAWVWYMLLCLIMHNMPNRRFSSHYVIRRLRMFLQFLWLRGSKAQLWHCGVWYMHDYQLWTVYFEFGCWNMQSVWSWLLFKVRWIGVHLDCQHSVSWSVCVVVWRTWNDFRWNHSYAVSYCYFWWKFKRAILFPSVSAQHTFRFKSRYTSRQRRSDS